MVLNSGPKKSWRVCVCLGQRRNIFGFHQCSGLGDREGKILNLFSTIDVAQKSRGYGRSRYGFLFAVNILFYIFSQVLHSVDIIIIISSCVCENIYYIIRIIRSIWFVSRAHLYMRAYAVKSNKMIYVDVLCALLIYAVAGKCRVDIRDFVFGGDVASWTFAKFSTRTCDKCKQLGAHAHHLMYTSTFMENEQVEGDENSSAIFSYTM